MKFCPNCGAELKPEARFCAACGTPVAVSETPQAQPTPPPTNRVEEPVIEHAKEATHAFTEAITGKTNLVQRVIRIITKPKEEWIVIANEQPDTMKLIVGYVLILSLIPALSGFLKYGIFGYSFMGYTYRSMPMGIQTLLTGILSAIIGVYLLAWVIDLLASSFESEKNFGKSLQLAVYASTPQWIAGILILLSIKMNVLIMLISLYAIYLLMTGLPVLKHTPKDKVAGYTVLTIICMIGIGLILALLLTAILGIFFATGSLYGM